jgi:hypothetical protein
MVARARRVGLSRQHIGCAALIESTRLDAALLAANLGVRFVDDIAAALTRHHVPFAFVTSYGRGGLPQAFAVAAMPSKPSSQQQLLDVAGKLVQRPADDITLRIWPFLCPMGKLFTACSDRAIAMTRSLANVWHVPDECDDEESQSADRDA